MGSQFPLWAIPFLPLAGAIINGLLALGGAKTKNGPSRGVVALIAVLCPLISCVLTGLLAASELSGEPDLHLSQVLWTWFATSDLHVDFNLLFDHLTSMMLLFVTGIGTLIHLYSVGYMWHDRGYARFMSYMNLFMFSMIMLVIGGSLPVTFLGWEGVGLCSYLLIGFWHHTKEYNDAARKAFIMNRIGDLGFLIGAFALVQVCSSTDYRVLNSWFGSMGDAHHSLTATGQMWLNAAGLLIFLGCTGKSAQIPLLTWLPDAMAGPTPVSALIHAATMVTSGVYLVARLAPLFAHCDPLVLNVILVVGCLTALYGAIAGLFQNDIKKALAYSTVSQLGYMFMAAGVGAHEVALFHVLTHAFFKATLFLGAGAIIHSLHHEQDLRKMGALHKLTINGRKPFALAFMCLAFGSWAILGLPFGSGFASKDLILEHLFHGRAMIGSLNIAPIVGVVALLTAGLTAVYITRVMVLAFWSPSRVSEEAREHVQGTPLTMGIPLFILGAGSLLAFMGWYEPFGMTPFKSYLDLDAPLRSQAHEGGTSWIITGAALLFALSGAFVAFAIWGNGPRGATVKQQPSTDPTGFGAAWTWAFDRVYYPIGVLVRVVALIASGLEACLAGGTFLVSEVSTFFGDGYAAIQRSRLRTNLAFSAIGLAAVLWIHQLAGAAT